MKKYKISCPVCMIDLVELLVVKENCKYKDSNGKETDVMYYQIKCRCGELSYKKKITLEKVLLEPLNGLTISDVDYKNNTTLVKLK